MGKRSLYLFLLLFGVSCFAVENERVGCYFITAKSGLNIRSGPDFDSRALFTLPEGEMVFYLGKKKPDVVAGRRGSWMLIRWKKRQGWAFSPYLEFSPAFVKGVRYDGNTLSLFHAFNRNTKKAEIRLNTRGQEIDGFTPELKYRNGRIFAEAVRPVVEHLHFIFYGSAVTEQLYRQLKSKKKYHFHVLVRQFVLKRKYIPRSGGGYFERHFTIRLQVVRAIRIGKK